MQRQKSSVLKDVAGLDGCMIYCVGFVGTRQRADVDRFSGRKSVNMNRIEQRSDQSCDLKGNVAYQPEKGLSHELSAVSSELFSGESIKGTSAPLLEFYDSFLCWCAGFLTVESQLNYG